MKENDISIVSAFPRIVREIENMFIPLAEGIRLAARIWLPEDAEQDPVPAILEFLPYRKRDGTSERDALTHPYYAGHGYACVRVDMRGAGDSEGILEDEYLKVEQDNALEVLEWIATQPWCSGQTGMIGISWGGFNGLQIAARRPPSLKAIVTIASTDDRYADDIHYMGGVMINDAMSWGATMFAFNSRPPDSANVGEGWDDLWMARLEANDPWSMKWLSHQTRDAFWQHGSVCENYADSLRGRWLGRRLFQCHTENAGRVALSQKRSCRPVGTQVPPFWASRPTYRFSAGHTALVGSLAEKQRYGHHG